MTPPRRFGIKKYIEKIPHNVKPYEFPPLSAVHFLELPNNGFGVNNYYIPKTKFGHWPVYLKIQNTKTTTEIKRIEGDINLFKQDLMAQLPQLQEHEVVVNSKANYVNVKGDVVDQVKALFDAEINFN